MKTPSYKNLTPLQYQQSYFLSLGWTIEIAIERIKSARAYQIKYNKENYNLSYRQINAALYLKHKNILAILLAK
jgi:hypothetical protein